jgi:hypothetical protein
LVVASILNNNALSFDDKSSTTFKLVVASIKNEDSKGPWLIVTFIKTDANIPLSDSEGVQSAQINLQTLWMIVNYICCPNFEGAQQVTPHTIRKESFKLINASNAKGVQASTNIQNFELIVASIKSKTSFYF